ncbi:MAG: hypothetical protein ACJA09_003010 [Alcanivorax sp.]|jgi:hypothetical protein
MPRRLRLRKIRGYLYSTSGNDYIAQEFKDFTSSSSLWKNSGINEKMTFYDMVEADHTFSKKEWREELFRQSERWLLNIESE